MIGTATAPLNTTLADFKEDGLVEIRDEALTILNQTKLARLAR